MPSTSTDRISGLSTSVAVKAPCVCATTANITLSGAQTIDGVAVVALDRVLVKDQTDTTENGVYVADSSAWSRAADFDGARDVVQGTLVVVYGGTQKGFWEITTSDPEPGEAMAFAVTNTSLAGVSVFAQTLLDDSTAGAFLTTLGVSAYVQTLLNDADAATFLTTLGISAYIQTLLDDASAATTLANLGVTATAAELNILDGITSTTAELNLNDVSAIVRIFEDGIQPQWDFAYAGTDPSTIGFVGTDAESGIAKAVTGADAAGTMATNGLTFAGFLMWKAETGGLVFETKISLSAITNVCLFFGFTDQNTSLEMPFTLGASDTLTSNATDAVGVLFDTGADTDNWWLVGVANDADATKQNTAVAPTAGVLETWRIEVSDAGAATFYRNGSVIGSQMVSAVRTSIALAHTISAFSRGAASRNIEYDYIDVRGTRNA